ncbi:MAG: FecR domain-containing protein [Pseudomonadota bacterium]
MTRHIISIAPFVATSFLTFMSLPAVAQTVGVNARVLNDVRMTTQANPSSHQAVIKERVSLGNDIQTGKASGLQVLLLDRTSFTLGANARIKVDRFVYDPARNASAVGLSVTKGAFRFMSGKALHANPGQSQIRTPIASIGIRGTIIDGVIGLDAIHIAARESGIPKGYKADPATASLILLRGPGANAQGEQRGAIDVTAGEKTVPVETAGYAVFVPGPGQPPIGPFQLSNAGSATLAMLLGSGRARNGASGPDIDPLESNPTVDQFFERDPGPRQNPSNPNGPGDPVNPNNPNSP